ncbi:hypothetical protein [Streptomyces sp. SID5606]|uniref:hypothetical protein n=1 Tax=Streptomyces sp. SID5606 TaxID=2690305 RepID=UPI001370DACB|nr:hypothetical protein [Streptomyces sp. SID5606]MZD58718.1 hypothetical protein [Streptomyces sp. SID5606]
MTSVEAREWDPTPALLKYGLKWAVTKAVTSIVLYLVLLPIVIAASRATHGWVHLVLGLLVASVFMALAQSVGAFLAGRGKSATVLVVLTAKFWLFAAVLALWPLLDLAGVSDDDKLSMMSGVLVGLAVILVIWVGWALIARRYEDIKHHPGHLKGWRWYLRLSMNVAGLIGGLVGIGLANM